MSFINLDPAGLNHSSPLGGASARDEQAVRKAATEFEALLLSQLTAALHPTENEDEDGLFSNSSTGFYRQMFSEQIATTMARSGGVGLADSILHQLGVNNFANGAHGARRAIELARAVRGVETENHPAHPPVKAAIEAAAASPVALPVTASQPVSLPAAPAAITRAKVEAPAVPPAEVSLEIPLKGRISSRFGARRDPLHGRHRHHAGVDIAAPRGTPIPAAAAGTVVFAGRRGGYGNLVEIEHADGRRTRYAHTDRILVTVGDEVQDGQPIATVGSTGRSTGPHLHFEIKENGAAVDPLQVVAKDSSRSRR